MSKRKKVKKPAKQHKSTESFFPFSYLQTIGLLLGLGFLFFCPVLVNDFVNFDDNHLILKNPVVTNSNFSPIFSWGRGTPHFKPIVFFTWILESKLFGFNPLVFHLNNLLLHLFSGCMVFVVIRHIGNYWFKDEKTIWLLAFFTALLFSIHPLRVESVAWATERKDVLFGAFYLIGIWSYLRYIQDKKYSWLLLTTLAYGCSMMSKSTGITLIAVLFLIDYAVKRELSVRLLLEKIPIGLMLLAGLYLFGLLTNFKTNTQGLTLGIADEINYTEEAANISSFTAFYRRILLVNLKLWFWFFHSLIPVRLSVIYPRKEIIESMGVLLHLLPLMTLACGTALVYFRKNLHLLFVAAMFFLITISPALAITDLGVGVFLSDRYTYIPGIGFALAFTYVSIILLKKFQLHQNTLFYGFSFLILLSGLSVFNNCKNWKNSINLWTNVIEKYPTVLKARIERASYYSKHDQDDKAFADLSKTIKQDSYHPDAYIEMGRLLRKQKRYPEALDNYNKLIKLHPNHLTAHINRGNIYQDIGELQKAIDDRNFVLMKNPDHQLALHGRGSTYGQMGKFNLALKDFNKLLELDPQSKPAYLDRLFVYYSLGQYELSLADFNAYLKLAPDDHLKMYERGIVKQLLHDHQGAIEDFNNAIRMDASNPKYYEGRAASYTDLNRKDLAQKDLNTVTKLKGNSPN